MTFQPPKSLVDILTYRRKSGSAGEIAFINKYIAPIPDIKRDKHGNYWKWVMNPDGSDPNLLWSVHTDTVHHSDGFQEVTFERGFLSLKFPKAGTCLGADDGAGLWLVFQMIRRRVPGLYLFHRDEECGGLGSKFIAKEHSDRLKGIKFAIALDRRGYDSVITEQWGGRCASDEFANQVAGLLGGKFKPDPTGSFTDTANYADLIPECTNLSVGYFDQHGPREKLDVGFLVALKNKLVRTDWSVLAAVRDPNERPVSSYTYYTSKSGKHKKKYNSYGQTSANSGTWPSKVYPMFEWPQIGTLAAFVKEHAVFVADVLEAIGYTKSDLEDYRHHCNELGVTVAEAAMDHDPADDIVDDEDESYSESLNQETEPEQPTTDQETKPERPPPASVIALPDLSTSPIIDDDIPVFDRAYDWAGLWDELEQ